MPKAFLTGLSGQDASYLAELLLEKGYEVFGSIRRHSNSEQEWGNSKHLQDKVKAYYVDLLDNHSIGYALHDCRPDEIYHLAAQSHVGISSKMPEFTMAVNANGTLSLLEHVRLFLPSSKIYFAATSECFGNQVDNDGMQRETTPMLPVSPYAVSKVAAYNLCKHYRDAYGMFICCGILFNHSSPRRGISFASQKIVKGAVAIKRGQLDKLHMGNLEASRDEGHAKDYVNAQWLMLQHESPDDYVISSMETHTIREFCDIVFSKLGLNYQDYVVYDEEFARPQELKYLKGDSTKARTILGWKPQYSFNDLIDDMLNSALQENNV